MAAAGRIVSPANLKHESGAGTAFKSAATTLEELGGNEWFADVWGRFSQASVSDDALDELLDTLGSGCLGDAQPSM